MFSYNTTACQILEVTHAEHKYIPVYHLAGRKQGGSLSPIGAVQGGAGLRLAVSKLDFNANNDYYITANGTTGRERLTEQLFSLNNIVIDVDAHAIEPREAQEVIESFIWRLNRDIIGGGILPEPNILHKTGRGVQLWWTVEQSAASLKWLYNNAVSHILAVVGSLISEYSELEPLEVDAAASKRVVGYYRLFGSYNTAVGLYGTPIIRHDRVYCIEDLLPSEAEAEPEPPERGQVLTLPTSGDVKAVNYKRVEALRQLVAIRGGAVTGVRHNLIFYYYNAAKMVFTDAQSLVNEVNSKFTQPLRSADIAAIVRCVDKRNHYRLTNTYIIEGLQITAQESQIIGILPTGSKVDMDKLRQNSTRDRLRKLTKEQRNAKILSMAAQGATNEAIAEAVGCTKKTVIVALESLKLDKKALQRDKIQSLKGQGMTQQAVAVALGLGIATVKRAWN